MILLIQVSKVSLHEVQFKVKRWFESSCAFL
jgi:hypothetical protein